MTNPAPSGLRDRTPRPFDAARNDWRAWRSRPQLQMDSLEWWRIGRVLPWLEGRLLDVGCGFNHLASAYRRRTGNLAIGVDIFPWPGVDVLVGDPARLPFAGASFETATVLAALNHFPNRDAALVELNRVLQPGGRLVLTMIGPTTGIVAHRLFQRDERERGGMSPGETPGLSQRAVLGLLARAGFRVQRQAPFQFGLNRVTIACKN